MFVGRDKELTFLNKEYRNSTSSFVVIYGRRRVGKTTLIKEFIKGKEALYFLASEELESANKKIFANKISKFTGQRHLANAYFEIWDDMFDIIIEYKKNTKKIIIIDEFQYLINANHAFSSIMQRIWDERLKDENIMLILCGSFISMMIKETLSYSSPLYGRRTGQINLKPVSFNEFSKFFISENNVKLINLYALTGGVPKYIEMFRIDKDIFIQIADNILEKSSFLYDEAMFLLEKEVKEIGSYFSILKVIACGNHKIGQIASNLELQTSKITPYLKTLIDLDILEKRVPVTEKTPERSRKGLYFIKDNFIKFWFRFVFKNRTELEIDNIKYVLDEIRNNLVDNHISYVYEDVAKEVLWQENSRGNLPFRLLKLGSYWNKNIEIDIVGLDEMEKNILIGECKYTNKQIGFKVYNELVEKVSGNLDLNKIENKIYVLFSKSGFEAKLLEYSKSNGNILLFDILNRVK